MKTFEREEHDAAFYMRSVRLNRKVQSSSSHGFSQIHLLHETPWRKCAIDSFDSIQQTLLIPYHLKVNGRQKIGCLQEQDQVIARTRPEKNCKQHTQDIVTYSRTIHEIMKTFEREEHDAAFYMRSVRLNRKVQSSSSHGFSQIHLLHETPWRKCAIDSFDSVKDFGDSILHQSQWQTKNLVFAETRLEQDQEIARNKTGEKLQASHPRHCHLFKNSFMKLWRHMKEKNMMQLFTWGMSDSLGRYNHQAHMVFHKFTYCMKHLEGNMHMIHLTL